MPAPDHSSFDYYLWLINDITASITTIGNLIARIVLWVADYRRPAGSKVNQILEERLNKAQKKIVRKHLTVLKWLNVISCVLLILVAAGSFWLYFSLQPPSSVDVHELPFTFDELDFRRDKWVQENPIFMPIVLRLAKQGQEGERTRRIADFRLFRGQTKNFRSQTHDHPAKPTHIHISFSPERYKVIFYSFRVRKQESRELYEYLPYEQGNGVIDFDIPASDPEDTILIMGLVSSKEGKLKEKLKDIFRVEVIKQ